MRSSIFEMRSRVIPTGVVMYTLFDDAKSLRRYSSPASIAAFGSRMKRANCSRSRRFVTSLRSGPASLPPPIVWQLVQF